MSSCLPRFCKQRSRSSCVPWWKSVELMGRPLFQRSHIEDLLEQDPDGPEPCYGHEMSNRCIKHQKTQGEGSWSGEHSPGYLHLLLLRTRWWHMCPPHPEHVMLHVLYVVLDTFYETQIATCIGSSTVEFNVSVCICIGKNQSFKRTLKPRNTEIHKVKTCLITALSFTK